VEVFKDRKTKLTLLSLISAAVLVSTAFAGISIYAQVATNDNKMIPYEEQALSSSSTTNKHTSEISSIANVKSSLDGMVVCDVGQSKIKSHTSSATLDNGGLPKVSLEVMTAREVASLESHDTKTSKANYEAHSSYVDCKSLDYTKSTTSSSASTSYNNKKLSTTPYKEVAVIEGRDFTVGQVVLVFSNNALVAIDDVDNHGQISARVPTDNLGKEIKFVESGTHRTASFDFNGDTLISSHKGDIVTEKS